MKQYTDHRAASLNVDDEWKELKDTIFKVADEVLGKRKKQKQRKVLNIWNDNIVKSIKEKPEAYKKWLQTKLPIDRSEYKKKCAIAKRE